MEIETREVTVLFGGILHYEDFYVHAVVPDDSAVPNEDGITTMLYVSHGEHERTVIGNTHQIKMTWEHGVPKKMFFDEVLFWKWLTSTIAERIVDQENETGHDRGNLSLLAELRTRIEQSVVRERANRASKIQKVMRRGGGENLAMK